MLLEGLNRGRPGLGVGRSRQQRAARGDAPSALSRAAREGAAAPPAAIPNGAAAPLGPGSSSSDRENGAPPAAVPNGAAAPHIPGPAAPSDHMAVDSGAAPAVAALGESSARCCVNVNGGSAPSAAPCGGLHDCTGHARLDSGAACSGDESSCTANAQSPCRGIPAEPCSGVGARADSHAAGSCAAVAAPATSEEQWGDQSGGAELRSSPAACPACSRACCGESALQSCMAHGQNAQLGKARVDARGAVCLANNDT